MGNTTSVEPATRKEVKDAIERMEAGRNQPFVVAHLNVSEQWKLYCLRTVASLDNPACVSWFERTINAMIEMPIVNANIAFYMAATKYCINMGEMWVYEEMIDEHMCELTSLLKAGRIEDLQAQKLATQDYSFMSTTIAKLLLNVTPYVGKDLYLGKMSFKHWSRKGEIYKVKRYVTK